MVKICNDWKTVQLEQNITSRTDIGNAKYIITGFIIQREHIAKRENKNETEIP